MRVRKNQGNAQPQKQPASPGQSRRRRMAVFAAAVLAAAVLTAAFIYKERSDGRMDSVALLGVWRYDPYTEYEFDGKGSGCMCLDGSNRYEFTYKAKDGTLYLDFALEYITDCQYTYAVNRDALTLVGGTGTAEFGKVYELTRVG